MFLFLRTYVRAFMHPLHTYMNAREGLCVCVREREIESEKEKERDAQREGYENVELSPKVTITDFTVIMDSDRIDPRSITYHTSALPLNGWGNGPNDTVTTPNHMIARFRVRGAPEIYN